MLLLDPLNSITSIQFYKKVSGQPAARTFGYLSYLSLIFAILAAVAFKVRIGPTLDATFLWMQTEIPTLVFEAGKVSTPELQGAKTVRHPKIPDLAVHIDASRTDPVTIPMMDDLKVKGYLAQNAMYLLDPQNQLKISDFSKSSAQKPLRVDAPFFRQAQSLLSKFLYPLIVAVSFLFFMLWKGLSSLFYSLVAMAVDAAADSKLTYGALFNVAVYAQTLIIAVQAIFLFMEAPLPLASFVSLGATTAYIWLALKAHAAPDASAA